MDELKYLSVYNVSFNKRKKIIPALCIGSYDIKRFEKLNFAIAYIDSRINPFTKRKEVCVRRFSDYNLKEDRLIIQCSFL